MTDRSGRHLGVAGIDININAAVKAARCSRRLVVLTITGEIVYDSHATVRGIIEQRNNAKMVMPRDALLEVFTGQAGTAVTEYDGRPAVLAFGPMVPGKYFLLHLLTD